MTRALEVQRLAVLLRPSGVYQDIYEALKPGVREDEVVALATKRLYEIGSDCVIEEEIIVTPGGAQIITLFPAQELPVANRY